MSDFDSRARQWDSDPEFIERGRRTAAAIRARVQPTSAMRALDVGCGTGQLSLPLAGDLAHITCIDASAGMLEVLGEKIAAQGLANLSAERRDLGVDDLPDGAFDLIMSSMTLHHIKDTDAMLAAFRAHLRPGGWLCLVDLDREDGSFHGAGVEVHHGFERAALAGRARAAGFAEVQFETLFVIRKARAGEARDYPVFFLSARRGPGS